MRKKHIELFSGGFKTSPTITKVDPFVPTTKAVKTARDLRRAVRARKTSEVKLFFEMFSQLPSWCTNLWILVVASIYGIKGTQIFRNGGKK